MDEILSRYALYMSAGSFQAAGDVYALLQDLVRMTYETADVMDSLGVEREDHVDRLAALVLRLRETQSQFFLLFPKPDDDLVQT